MTNCIFCKIIRGEIPGKFVHRDEEMVVFHDISPKAPVHVLVVPVTHVESLKDVQTGDQRMLGNLLLTIRTVAEQLNIAQEGFKVIMNNGKASGQIVDHLHAHVLGGWKKKREWEV